MVRKFEKIVFLSICLMLLGICTTNANMQKIEVILEYGMSSSFDASEGTQTLTSHNGAKVFLDNGNIYTFGKTNLVSTFTGANDTSGPNPPGLASATFSGGTWTVQLYSPVDINHLVLSISGTTDWYRENEAINLTNKVDGVGKVTLNMGTLYIDSAYWGDATWGSTDGKSAITSTITSAHHVPSGNLINYQTDWVSPNVTVVVWADSSKAVPEPATIAILALGGLLFIRKRS